MSIVNKNLKRFEEAQETDYLRALEEIKSGRKRSHWMWYIFPQIKGLGHSSTSKFYAIENAEEAKAYLHHPVLGNRLVGISQKLLELDTNDPEKIFGKPDNLKLKSSMTLFASLPETDPVFAEVLKKYFSATVDRRTLEILEKQK